MTEWIEINMPWMLQMDIPNYPSHLNDIAQEKFGLDKVCKDFEKRWNNSYSFVINSVVRQFHGEIQENCLESTPEDYAHKFAEARDAKLEELSRTSNKLKEALYISETLLKKHCSFIANHPDYIAWEVANKERESTIKKGSFRCSEYCKPGVLIECDTNGELIQLLIGDINVDGISDGDEADAFNDGTIIRRVKVLEW